MPSEGVSSRGGTWIVVWSFCGMRDRTLTTYPRSRHVPHRGMDVVVAISRRAVAIEPTPSLVFLGCSSGIEVRNPISISTSATVLRGSRLVVRTPAYLPIAMHATPTTTMGDVLSTGISFVHVRGAIRMAILGCIT